VQHHSSLCTHHAMVNHTQHYTARLASEHSIMLGAGCGWRRARCNASQVEQAQFLCGLCHAAACHHWFSNPSQDCLSGGWTHNTTSSVLVKMSAGSAPENLLVDRSLQQHGAPAITVFSNSIQWGWAVYCAASVNCQAAQATTYHATLVTACCNQIE
jgi:hypothetical protein